MLLLACILALCSDDPFPLGNESLAWDASAGTTYYEVCRFDFDPPICMTSPTPTLSISGTVLLAPNDTALLSVRACNQSNPEMPPACSAWSADAVEVLPYACLRTSCEEPCFLGAPRRYPHLPLCPEGLP